MITLKTLPQATAQEVFDQVARHLLTQRKRSVSSEGSSVCMYRGIDGLKCAAGCLIADDEYLATFEHTSWLNLFRDQYPHEFLIAALQRIHDGFTPGAWRYDLAMLAEREGLSPAVLEEFPDEPS